MHMLVKRVTYRGIAGRLTMDLGALQSLGQGSIEGRSAGESAKHESLETRRETSAEVIRIYFVDISLFLFLRASRPPCRLVPRRFALHKGKEKKADRYGDASQCKHLMDGCACRGCATVPRTEDSLNDEEYHTEG